MKKIVILIGLVAILGNLFAIEINLSDGRKFSGKFQEIKDGMIIIIEGKVVMQIPVQEVKMIMDGGKDVTKDFLKPKVQTLEKPKLDDHFLQPDDYFILEDPLGNSAWIYVFLAKMMTPPSKETKDQAQFMIVMDGVTKWHKDWVSTHIATKEDIKLGKEVIFIDLMDANGIYRAPESNQETRQSYWLMSRITDLSELFKGYVLVGDGLQVSTKALRVLD